MDRTNFSRERWVNDGVNVPVKLGMFSHSAESYEKGCIPGNIGQTRKVGEREFILCTSLIDLTVGLPVAGVIATNLIDAATGVKSTDLPGVGATRIHLNEASFTATTEDLYAGAYISVYGGTGLGYTYEIRSNSAFFDTDEIYVDIYDGLVSALDATSNLEILLPKETAVAIGDNDAAERIFGVCTHVVPAATDISASTIGATGYYFWAQTKGPILMNPDAVTTAGQLVMVDADVGQVINETAGYITVGQTVHIGTDGAVSTLIDLKLS